MPIDVICFDCDGVLLDSVGIKTDAFASLFREHGPEAEAFMVNYHLANGGVSRYEKFRHFYRHWFKREITEAEMAGLDERFTKACLSALLTTPMIPGAREFLEANNARDDGLPLYVASGAPHQELVFILDHMGLTGHFRAIYGSPPAKAQLLARVVDEAKAEFGVEPGRVLMVGDSSTDLLAAQLVGTAFLGVGEFEPPHPWLPDLTELAAWLIEAG